MGDDEKSSSDLSLQLANLIKNSFPSQSQNPKLSDSLQINLKLNSQNYALWTRMIRVAISGKSKALLTHLTSDPPDEGDEKYEQWEQDDLIVFSWLIQNIELVLASNLTEFPTAKMLWNALVVTYSTVECSRVTYSSGKDKLQPYNLHVKANEMKQNDMSLENMWISLQGIWGEIDRINPNPMKCPDISKPTPESDPLPSAEEAYAAVRKEESHQNILGINPKEVETGVAAGLVATDSNGSGFITKGARRSQPPKEDKTILKCAHCGMMKHTKDQCFKLVGYPEWWSDGHKKNKNKPSTMSNNDSTGFGGMAAAMREEETSVTDKGFEVISSYPTLMNYNFIPESKQKG